MWYRGTNPYAENNRLAKPLGSSFHKHKKKKIKHFDSSEDGMQTSNLIEPVVEPKTPANITEIPDLPAGVDIPPVQHPPKVPIQDEKHLENKKQKPKELEKLYGEDHDIQDDGIITQPQDKTNDEIKHPFDSPDLDLEQGILDILDGTADDELVEEEAIPDEDVAPEQEPDQSTQPVPNPPIHEGCHCEIITMPGGRRIWRANEGACSDCINTRNTFNQWQLSLFGS